MKWEKARDGWKGFVWQSEFPGMCHMQILNERTSEGDGTPLSEMGDEFFLISSVFTKIFTFTLV